MPYALHITPERTVAGPLWTALRGRTEPASIAELHRATRAHPNAIQLRLKRWQRAGFVDALPGGEPRFAAVPCARPPVGPSSYVAPIWNAVVAGPATAAEIARATAGNPDTVSNYLRMWVRRGRVIILGGGPRRFMLADTAPDLAAPPKVTATGGVGAPRQMRQRLWTAMRILKRFDLPTLLITSEATRRSAEDFINLLTRGGYLVNERRGNPVTGEWSSYCLVRRSGPIAPVFGHTSIDGRACRTLRDPNSGDTAIIPPARERAARSTDDKAVPPSLNHEA